MLNIFTERDAELYILDNTTMYFVGRDWDPNAKELEFDDLPFFTCTSGYDYEEISDFKLFTDTLKTQFSQNKIIYRAYVVLFLITIISIFLRNKKLPK